MPKSSIDDFIRIAYPFESLNEHQSLDDYYISMYGKKYQDLIKERINKTLYIFESNPIETYSFFKENEDNIFDWEQFEMIETFYKDFIALKEKYEQETEEKIYQQFCHCNNLNPSIYKNKKEEIIHNISTYTSYQELCDSISIAPLNCQDYAKFLKQREKLKDEESNNIIKRSLWAKDIIATAENCNILITEESLCSMLSLNSNTTASCYNYESLTIVRCPLIEIYRKGFNLDVIFLHENRHAIEAGMHRNVIGINNQIVNLYLLNEVRTERHAQEDDKVIPTIFSKRKTNDLATLYDNFIPVTNILFTAYEHLFDTCAIENNIAPLFQAFNRDNLIDFEQLCKKSYQSILDFQKSDEKELFINLSSHADMEKKLVKQAYKNGFKPYQH